MSKKLKNLNKNLREAVGSLAYIPSEVVVFKLTETKDSNHPAAWTVVHEPAVVPLLSVTTTGMLAEIYYEGDHWWVDAGDLYEVSEK